MSGKQVKLARKQINHLIQDRMEHQPQKPQLTLEHLNSYISLHHLLTGKKPDKIELTEPNYKWVMQMLLSLAEDIGVTPEFKDGKPSILGVPIEQKILIATAVDMPKN